MKLLYLVTEDWYFVSHRLPLAIQARTSGYDVTVVTRVGRHGETIRNAGLKLIPLDFERRSLNPLRQLLLIWQLTRIYRRERPELVHQVALKPVLLGTIAARLAGVPGIVNAIAGLGWLFSARSWTSSLFSGVIRRVLVPLLNQGVVIVQNPDDRDFLSAAGVNAGNIRLIKGAGVDTKKFCPVEEPQGLPVVMLASRLLWDKGVGEFVQAANLLRKAGVSARFVLVGEPDIENPAAVPATTLASWSRDADIEWWGRRDEMPGVIAQCHVFCLPSFYGEGIPKVLLEAAASGRPIVATDTPGCKEIVHNDDNGFLVPIRNVTLLAEALLRLINDPALRQRMGKRGRERSVSCFSIEQVISETLAAYRELDGSGINL